MYYTYVLRSIKNGSLYIGSTEDLKRRFAEHNEGKSEYTSKYTPWELVYYEAGRSKESAIKREKQLKTGFGRAYLKRRIS